MDSQKGVLFKKCPLCGEGSIEILTYKRGFFIPSFKIQPCPFCSATFTAGAGERYRLQYCVPSKVIERRGGHECRNRVYRGCYLGATLAKSEWERIAEGGESDLFEKFLEASERFKSGSLPVYPTEGLPIVLDRGEVVHYVSSPIYVNDQQPSYREPRDKCDLIVTNKRVILIRETGTLHIPFENVERLEEALPGFLIQEKGSFEPLYLYPPLYDPVLEAIKGAVHNFQKSRSH